MKVEINLIVLYCIECRLELQEGLNDFMNWADHGVATASC